MSLNLQHVPAEELPQWDREHLWHPLMQHQSFQEGASPLFITDGRGCFVTDSNHKQYLDAAAGLWCVNVGYGRKELVEAAMTQMSRLAYYPLTQSHPSAVELSHSLSRHLPNNPHVYFSNSGSEANEAAFKMVRQYWRQLGHPRKSKILSRHRGYHGSTLGALSATGQAERTRDYEPLAPGFIQVSAPYCYRCPFKLSYPTCNLQCAQDFARRIEIEGPETVAAIIVEPVTAGGGVLVTPPDYLQKVREIADEYDVLLIVDEVVTGFGRTGSMFAHQAMGIEADIVTMAKGLASGYMAIGATAASSRLFEAFLGATGEQVHFRHVNTFSGHPVACAVALENIHIIEREELAAHTAQMGKYMVNQLRLRLGGHPLVGDIRGLGLLIGVELVELKDGRTPVADSVMRGLSKALLEGGIIVGKTTDVLLGFNNILMLAPPLVITKEEVDLLCDAIACAIVSLV